MKITFKDVIFILIFGAIIAGFAFWQGKKECEKEKNEETEWKVVEGETEWKITDGKKEWVYPKYIYFEYIDFDSNEVITNPNITKLNLSYFPEKEKTIIAAAAVRNNLKVFLYPILYAIRKAENGAKRRELGIIHPRCEVEMNKRPNETLDIQAGWAAATVQKNYDRWIKAGGKGRYIVYLARRFCPVGADNDPDGLNKNWIGNVTHWADKIRG